MSFDLKFQNNTVKLLTDADLNNQTVSNLKVNGDGIAATAYKDFSDSGPSYILANFVIADKNTPMTDKKYGGGCGRQFIYYKATGSVSDVCSHTGWDKKGSVTYPYEVRFWDQCNKRIIHQAHFYIPNTNNQFVTDSYWKIPWEGFNQGGTAWITDVQATPMRKTLGGTTNICVEFNSPFTSTSGAIFIMVDDASSSSALSGISVSATAIEYYVS